MTTNSSDIEFIKLDVQDRIKLLGEKLTEQDPMLPVHLSAIHGALIQYEELVHLLPDSDIATLVAAQSKHVGVKLTKEVTEGKKATVGKRIPKTTVDDL